MSRSTPSSTSKTRKFRHDDAQEGMMPERVRPPYEDLDITNADVRVTHIGSVAPFYRTMLSEVPEAAHLTDTPVYALGMHTEDREDCTHALEIIDRFGHARCTRCSGFVFHAAWIADGLYGEDTIAFAEQSEIHHAERLRETVRRTARSLGALSAY